MCFPSRSSASSGTSPRPPERPGAEAGRVAPAVFFVSAAALANEIVLIRLLSFRFWPHFVPLIVSQAMLGLGAAGVALQLARRRVGTSPGRFFAWAVLLAAPAFDLAFRASQRVSFDPFLLLWDVRAWVPFALFFLLLAVPFFLAGAATAIPFAFLAVRTGPVYAAAFAGSAAGAFLALLALDLLPTELLLRLPPGLGLAGAAFVVPWAGGRVRLPRACALCAGAALMAAPAPVPALSPYKDLAVARKLPEAREIASRSGASGDYRALFAKGIHSAPGLSIRFSGEVPPQAALFGDGESIGIVPKGGGRDVPEYLDHFPAVLPYRLCARPRVLQFGLRGTEGVLTAARNGAASVTVVEPSRELAAMIGRDLAGFSGGWPRALPVEVVDGGARNFLAADRRFFDIVEVADISSMTFSALGIHATGETFLLTREGVRAAMARAGDSGLLVFSGWIKVPPRESVKILRTIRAELEAEGHAPAASRVAMIRGWGSFSVVVRRTPFGAPDVARIRAFCDALGFSAVWPPPGAVVPDGAEERALLEAVAASLEGPAAGAESALFDLSPVTDDSPYFHRLLRLRGVPEFRRLLGKQWIPFVEWGVVFLLLSLAVSIVVAALFLLLPVPFARGGRQEGGAAVAVCFSALGLGYMLVELIFLKEGVLVLGESTRAAGLAIGAFAFFSGIGSLVSGRAASGRAMGRVFAGIAAAVAAGFLVLSASAESLLARGLPVRSAAFVAALAPAAILMGIPFPVAISRLAAAAPRAVPFAWALNGFFSVAGASLASIGALWIGFRGTVLAGAALYVAAGLAFRKLGAGSR